MKAFVVFKTSPLIAIGYRRVGVWGESTARQRIAQFSQMFGALAAPKSGAGRGLGAPLSSLTLGVFAFPAFWDWYIEWRRNRRGFYTRWEVGLLSVASDITKPETGWLPQNSELAERVRSIAGLISPGEVKAAAADWKSACQACHLHVAGRAKELKRMVRVHRDPFEPILPVLEAASPVGEYRKITDEVLRLAPNEARYPLGAAEACRSFLMLRLGLHLGFRQRNLRQLLFCRRGHKPRSEKQLVDFECGELRWNDHGHAWEVFIPAAAFKNANSTFFRSRPLRIVLPDLAELYAHLEAYIQRHRGILLGASKDPGTFFIKTMKATMTNAAFDRDAFYGAWRRIIERYGIYNPYTGRGAIAGLLPHGPHSVRDVLATHILKHTGSFEQASYAIQDTPKTVAEHYGRFLPHDKAAIAAQILNKAWEPR